MTAADQILALESIDNPTPEQIAAARAAIDSEIAAAQERVFPSSIPAVSGDAYTAYRFHIDRLSTASFGAGMAALHARALEEHPDLARLLRTADPALVDVTAAAACGGVPRAHETETLAEASARVEADARRRYVGSVCRQLVEAEHAIAPDARAFLAVVDLEGRLAAIRARAEERAAAAAARAEEERRIAARGALDRALAAVAVAAETATKDANTAAASERAYLQARTVVLVEKLKLYEGDTLYVGRHERFGVQGLIVSAPHMGAHDVDRFIAALDRAENAS